MKKMSLVLAVIFVMFLSTSAFALNSPQVVKDHGVLSIMAISKGDNNLNLNGEYGLNDDIAITGAIGDPYDRIGLKFERTPQLAITGGILLDETVYVGINSDTSLSDKVLGMMEVGITRVDDSLSLLYDFEAKYDLPDNIDVRGGVTGVTEGDPHFKLGVGINF